MKNEFNATILIHTSYSRWPMLSYELDIIQRELDKNNKVIILYCNGQDHYCPANNINPEDKIKKRYCSECSSKFFRGMKWLKSKPNQIQITPYDFVADREIRVIESVNALLEKKEKSIENIKETLDTIHEVIFNSSYSQLLTELRSSYISINENWTFFKKLINNGLISFFSAKEHLKNFSPDYIFIFNGRIARYQPLMRLAQSMGIDFYIYEYPKNNYYQYTFVKNFLTHDIKTYSSFLKELLNEASPSKKEIAVLAGKWYKNRRGFNLDSLAGRRMRQAVKLSKKNEKDELFLQLNNKKIVTFYVSSPYEMIAIPENEEINDLDQFELIYKLIKDFPSLTFVCGLHPMMTGIEAGFVKKFIDFKNTKKLKNIHIIEPNDTMDSYELLNISDLILTCGSTIGAEAAYIGKPVLVYGLAYYMNFGCAKNVSIYSDLEKILKKILQNDWSDFPIEERRIEGASNFAWAFINQGREPKYINKNSSYFDPILTREGSFERIKANFFIRKFNFLVDLQKRIFRRIIKY